MKPTTLAIVSLLMTVAQNIASADPNDASLEAMIALSIIVSEPRTEPLDLLTCHDGFWVADYETDDRESLTVVNDTHIDVQNRRTTVYAQITSSTGDVIAPPQLNTGECRTDSNDETVCFHPNAVYLNGSGQELAVADGTGDWWAKYSWIDGGPAYYNCQLAAREDYQCAWVKARLLDDGKTMRIGGVNAVTRNIFDTRSPIVGDFGITYEINRYLDLGWEPLEPTFSLTADCIEDPSPLDGRRRACPHRVHSRCGRLVYD
ncbi:MAG: hypothetical protein AAFX44_06975 [Pseudomonadota bacterium]